MPVKKALFHVGRCKAGNGGLPFWIGAIMLQKPNG
jgi:hypothetical protein